MLLAPIALGVNMSAFAEIASNQSSVEANEINAMQQNQQSQNKAESQNQPTTSNGQEVVENSQNASNVAVPQAAQPNAQTDQANQQLVAEQQTQTAAPAQQESNGTELLNGLFSQANNSTQSEQPTVQATPTDVTQPELQVAQSETPISTGMNQQQIQETGNNAPVENTENTQISSIPAAPAITAEQQAAIDSIPAQNNQNMAPQGVTAEQLQEALKNRQDSIPAAPAITAEQQAAINNMSTQNTQNVAPQGVTAEQLQEALKNRQERITAAVQGVDANVAMKSQTAISQMQKDELQDAKIEQLQKDLDLVKQSLSTNTEKAATEQNSAAETGQPLNNDANRPTSTETIANPADQSNNATTSAEPVQQGSAVPTDAPTETTASQENTAANTSLLSSTTQTPQTPQLVPENISPNALHQSATVNALPDMAVDNKLTQTQNLSTPMALDLASNSIVREAENSVSGLSMKQEIELLKQQQRELDKKISKTDENVDTLTVMIDKMPISQEERQKRHEARANLKAEAAKDSLWNRQDASEEGTMFGNMFDEGDQSSTKTKPSEKSKSEEVRPAEEAKANAETKAEASAEAPAKSEEAKPAEEAKANAETTTEAKAEEPAKSEEVKPAEEVPVMKTTESNLTQSVKVETSDKNLKEVAEKANELLKNLETLENLRPAMETNSSPVA